MDQLSKDLGSSKNDNSRKDKENMKKLWDKSSTDAKIWFDHSIRESKSRRTLDEKNLEKIWGKRK